MARGVQPTALDRLIAAISPERALRRVVARQRYSALTGGYSGARKDRRATSEWQTSGGSADADLLVDLPALRERSRDLVRNQPIARGAINRVVTNVVGVGLTLQPDIDEEALGLTEDQADAWQAEAYRAWCEWSESVECDLGRRLTFDAVQALVLRSVLESGDHFVVFRDLPRAGSDWRLKLQLLEADRVCNPNFTSDGKKLSNGNTNMAGIEIDPVTGAAAAIYVASRHPGDSYLGRAGLSWQRLPMFGSRSGMRLILQVYDVQRAGQSRGEPFLAPVIEPLKQLERYTEAELMAAVIGGMFTVFVKTEGGAGVDALGSAPETGAQAGDSDFKLGSGAIIDLKENEDISVANPGRPNQAFDPFVQAVLRQIGMALEIPFELLLLHFTASYSAARGAILEAWRAFRARREWLVRSLCQPVYEAWLWEAVASGRLMAPGFAESAALRKAWSGANWIGPGPGQLDIKKEAEGLAIIEDRAWMTGQEITGALTGGDYRRKLRQRGREEREKQAAGLGGVPVSQTTPDQPTDTVVEE